MLPWLLLKRKGWKKNMIIKKIAKHGKILKSVDGIVVPGGFDSRGVEGKILACQWAREHEIPYLGLCLGMQVMIIEAARSLLNLETANSTEFDPHTQDPVICLMSEQKHINKQRR